MKTYMANTSNEKGIAQHIIDVKGIREYYQQIHANKFQMKYIVCRKTIFKTKTKERKSK